MTYFERMLLKNDLVAVLQKEEGTAYLEYALLLNKDQNGVVFASVGSGCFDYGLVIGGEVVFYEDEDKEELDWDNAVIEWSKDSGEKPEYIEKLMDILDILGPSIDGGAVVMTDDYLPLFKTNNVLFTENIKPLDFGNMSWK